MSASARQRRPDWLQRVFGRGRPPLVLSLRSVGAARRGLVGGKAANLGRMLQAGLPVPAGFCVTTAAFERFLTACPRHAHVSAALAQSATAASGEVASLSRQALACLADARLPEAVVAAVLQAWRRQGRHRACAVRSSATVEDAADHSFAGQFESFLNVRGEDALLEAIRQCWLSLFSERSLAYQVNHGLSPGQAAMAVVVQEMLAAEYAGVMFTADPATGCQSRMVIEAVPGTGEALVAGRVNPERLVMHKASLRILRRGSPDKECLLHEPVLRQLGRLGRKVERVLGRPQDIEWAVAGGGVFLLQTRPVTTASPARSWEHRQVWSNVNSGEVAPDVMTPASWSVICLFLNRIAESTMRLMGADVSHAPVVGRVAGRVYFSVNTGLAIMKPFFFLLTRIPNFEKALGGGEVMELHRQGLIDIPDEDLPDLGFSWANYLLSWPRILFTLLAHSPRRGDAWTRRLQERQDALADLDLDSMSTPDLLGFLEEWIQTGFEGWDLMYLFTQAASLPVFQKACRDWLDDPDLAMGYRLFAGLGGMPETEAGLALWRLAVLAHAERETETAVLSGDSWKEVRARLDQTSHGLEFLAAWRAFMTEHGHHCRGELELFNPRWSERPDYILGIVRGYLRAVDHTNPLANHRRLAQERERLTARCHQRLKNPIKRWVFARALRRAQQLAINREEWKSQAVRHLTVLRRVLLALGKRLERDGVMARADDIFLLELPEVAPVVTGRAPFDAKAVIAQRRAEYEQNLTLTPPPVVTGRFDPATSTTLPADRDATVLQGTPIFPGVITGLARVILRADDHEQVLPGEILVAPFTDPAWSPYFVTAAAAVMDQGGILSHGSIVAREYGLPAVTNVRAATQIIRTGDVVRVDGAAGRVMILERARANR
jgi:pyruvate,water dikinase